MAYRFSSGITIHSINHHGLQFHHLRHAWGRLMQAGYPQGLSQDSSILTGIFYRFNKSLLQFMLITTTLNITGIYNHNLVDKI